MRTVMLVVLLASAITTPASADPRWENYLVGPVIGYRLGQPAEGDRLVYGIEGGAGIGPERINIGLTRRLDKSFLYVELDPWFVIGASLGVGVDSDRRVWPVIGVWEGLPLWPHRCVGAEGKLYGAVTLAVGYRWTGVHELYATVKAGATEPLCYHEQHF